MIATSPSTATITITITLLLTLPLLVPAPPPPPPPPRPRLLPPTNLTGNPSPYPYHPVLCYDRRHATHPPLYPDCENLITTQIVTGATPAFPIRFSRHWPHNNVPKVWVAPKAKCSVMIDVQGLGGRLRGREGGDEDKEGEEGEEGGERGLEDSWEESSLVEVQAAARRVLIGCVVGDDGLGGFTMAGRRGNLLVEILGHKGVVGEGGGLVREGGLARVGVGPGEWVGAEEE